MLRKNHIAESPAGASLQDLLQQQPECVRPQDALLANMELPLRRTFYPLGYPIEIITNHPAVLEAAQESFGHAHLVRSSSLMEVRIGVIQGSKPGCPAEPARRQYNYLMSLVADPENQALLDLKACVSFAWLTQGAVDNRRYFRYNFLEKIVYLLLGASVVTDLHAACISKNGQGVLLCGPSGAGKSTLSYACARAGWTYVSDDTSYLINDSDVPRVIGHSHRIRFRPEARAIFPELSGRPLTERLEGKPSVEIPVSELLPALVTATEATVHSVVYLKRYPSAKGAIVSLPKGTATQRTCQDLYSAGEIRAKHERVLEIFSVIPAYELHYSGPHDAIHQLDILAARGIDRAACP